MSEKICARIDELEAKQGDPRLVEWAQDVRRKNPPVKLGEGAYGSVWTTRSEPHKARDV